MAGSATLFLTLKRLKYTSIGQINLKNVPNASKFSQWPQISATITTHRGFTGLSKKNICTIGQHSAMRLISSLDSSKRA
jgi:hypothetical protein